MKQQRIAGAVMILCSLLLIALASRGSSAEEKDITAVLFLLPLGVYMLITRKNIML